MWLVIAIFFDLFKSVEGWGDCVRCYDEVEATIREAGSDEGFVFRANLAVDDADFLFGVDGLEHLAVRLG